MERYNKHFKESVDTKILKNNDITIRELIYSKEFFKSAQDDYEDFTEIKMALEQLRKDCEFIEVGYGNEGPFSIKKPYIFMIELEEGSSYLIGTSHKDLLKILAIE